MARVVFALLFGWAIVARLDAQSLTEAASQLAARISSQLPRRATVSLELQNLTASTPADSSTFRNALEEELRKAGLQIMAATPENRLRISVSENVRGLLLVAELLSGENRTVVMLPWTAPPSVEAKPRLRILRKPVWEQTEAVLDFLLLNSESDLLVLNPGSLSSFHMNDGRWILTGGMTLSLSRPPARDPRGRIQNASGGFRVYVPGATCSGTLQPALKVACSPANDPWPADQRDPSFAARWVKDRNVMESAGLQGAFYSGAHGWFSTVDHRIMDRAGESLVAAEPLGSDFAGIESACISNPVLLASDAGDAADRDHARAYELTSGRATAASEPLPLPGRITALWPAETAGQVTLVVQNSKTGKYEASRLGLGCAE